jgi:23S rRNA (adenine2503-C2)-methyltransferase
MTQPKTGPGNALDLTPEDWDAWVRQHDLPGYRSGQILDWIYGKRVSGFREMTNLPEALRGKLEADFLFSLPEVVREQGSADTTRKFLLRMGMGDLVEAVLIPASPALYGEASDRRTLCVSSQVGCAYGCKFCASGLDGWKRNLSAGEIVAQLLLAEKLSGEKVNNIVFMGMGEPLANLDHLLRAIAILSSPRGLGIGTRHLTVSTSGLVPGIRKLAETPGQVRLAISLHGATNEIRDLIMPVNRKYPLPDLLDACDYFNRHKKQFVTFEFILIRDINDSNEQAEKLAGIVKPLRAKVNLIPYNRVEDLPWERPSVRRQEEFLSILKKSGVAATLRREKGHDIAAACGQLRLQAAREKTCAPAAAV